MSDQLPLNKNPLNQLAKSALAKVGGDPDPGYLYSVQLAQWMLDTHPDLLPSPADQYAWELSEHLANMATWEPETLQEYLLLNREPEDNVSDAASLLAEQSREDDPETLGATLVEALHHNLQKQVPSLRPASGL